ncbi:hypothetical protein F5B20DRAFT_577406 [Whalleya microplaca]|nr:hypothetical protein F5B20DRAFT_577406 [Whalleya microplaca]
MDATSHWTRYASAGSGVSPLSSPHPLSHADSNNITRHSRFQENFNAESMAPGPPNPCDLDRDASPKSAPRVNPSRKSSQAIRRERKEGIRRSVRIQEKAAAKAAAAAAAASTTNGMPTAPATPASDPWFAGYRNGDEESDSDEISNLGEMQRSGDPEFPKLRGDDDPIELIDVKQPQQKGRGRMRNRGRVDKMWVRKDTRAVPWRKVHWGTPEDQKKQKEREDSKKPQTVAKKIKILVKWATRPIAPPKIKLIGRWANRHTWPQEVRPRDDDNVAPDEIVPEEPAAPEPEPSKKKRMFRATKKRAAARRAQEDGREDNEENEENEEEDIVAPVAKKNDGNRIRVNVIWPSCPIPSVLPSIEQDPLPSIEEENLRPRIHSDEEDRRIRFNVKWASRPVWNEEDADTDYVPASSMSPLLSAAHVKDDPNADNERSTWASPDARLCPLLTAADVKADPNADNERSTWASPDARLSPLLTAADVKADPGAEEEPARQWSPLFNGADVKSEMDLD